MPRGPRQDLKSDDARIAELEAKISRHQVVQQQLVSAKGQLDRELQRFTVIQQYVQKAVLAEDLDTFYRLTIESVVEAFEFEIALITRSVENTMDQKVVATFGFDDEFPTPILTVEEGWILTNQSSIIAGDHPLLRSWRTLKLREIILCPFYNRDGDVAGYICGGRTDRMGDYFDALSNEICSSFQVMVGQAGALLVNHTLSDEVRQHNEELVALTKSFSRFVPFEFLELLGRASIQSVLPADNVSLEMTVLFVDLRDFTTLSESLGPERTFGMLNEYLGAIQPPISASGGFINHYQGDGLMALFHRGPDTALAASVSIVEALEALNAKRVARGENALRIGMGLNTGELMLGAIGGEDRLDSNVIGDAANLASRIEGLTKIYGSTCILTEHTLERLVIGNEISIRELDRVIVRGRVEPVAVYELLDVEPPETRGKKIASAAVFEKALSMYRKGDFAMAIGRFAQCVATCGEDVAAKLYVQRCAEFVQNAPGQEWKGVTILDGG